MPFIELIENNTASSYKIKIMIFTEGTILVPRNLLSLFSFENYIPAGNCVSKINSWVNQGAEVVYFTSRKSTKQVQQIEQILRKYHFSGTCLYYRSKKDKYKDIVEQVKPNVLIEDDCKSIGGSWQMCITYIEPSLKKQIKSIVVREYRGIENLPDSLMDLYGFGI